MKTPNVLEQEILDITMKIHVEFPQLFKYISEMTDNSSIMDRVQINRKKFKEYCNSLEETLSEYAKAEITERNKFKKVAIEFPEYPIYSPSDNVLGNGLSEKNLKQNDLSKMEIKSEEDGARNKKVFAEDITSDDLDLHRLELTDHQESIRIEAGENNY